jgi:glycolate oxidase iron-sulfur subunit
MKPIRTPQFVPPSLLAQFREDISRCVKCGACRAVCPTFLLEREESLSPRGRLALVRAVLDGRLKVSARFKDRLATCTGCLACEAACPSSVPVTRIIQVAKEQAVTESGAGVINAAISEVVKHPVLFRSAAWLAPLLLHYAKEQGSGIGGDDDRLPGRVQRSHRTGPRRQGQGTKGTILFFPGCAVAYLQRDIGIATVGVLSKMGYEVIIPKGLKCCGRPLLSLGDHRAAAELAEHNREQFAKQKGDVIVTACASCSLTFKKEYPRLLPPGRSPAVLDIHEFLSTRINSAQLGPLSKTVTWHDPCHLGRGQGLSKTARDILLAIPGLALVEMKNADRCCGFGGVMRMTHKELSDGIAEDKARSIIATAVSTVVTGCPGCRLQIADSLRRKSFDIEVVHTVQLLEEALEMRCADRETGSALCGCQR